MAKAMEATEEDIEVEVDTEEVTKEIINKHQINMEIMVENNKEKGSMKIKHNLNRIMGIKWDPSQVVCYKCFGMGHYSRGCAYRGREWQPKPSRVWWQGQTLDPGNNTHPKPKKRKQKKFMQGSKFKHQRHFSGSNGGSK